MDSGRQDFDDIEEISSNNVDSGNISLTTFRESLTNGDLRDISEKEW